MKLMTRDTDYAVRALCFMAKKDGEVVSVNEFVRCLKVPRPFIRKILQTLNRDGVLKSHKGKGGGFVLAMDGCDITLANLIEIFQGPLTVNDHRFKKGLCHEVKRCPLKKRLDGIEEYLRNELKNITVASLLRNSTG